MVLNASEIHSIFPQENESSEVYKDMVHTSHNERKNLPMKFS